MLAKGAKHEMIRPVEVRDNGKLHTIISAVLAELKKPHILFSSFLKCLSNESRLKNKEQDTEKDPEFFSL